MKVQLVELVGYGIFVGSLHARQCTRSPQLTLKISHGRILLQNEPPRGESTASHSLCFSGQYLGSF